MPKLIPIVVLALFTIIGCMRTESVTVRGPNGEETVNSSDSLIASERTVVVLRDQAYRDCLSVQSPAIGSSAADAYCRSVTAPGSNVYAPQGTYVGGVWYPAQAPLGRHINQGSIADPDVANAIVANARANAAYPEAAKNPQDLARRSELRTVAREVNKLGEDVAAVNADLQDHKKNGHETPKTPPKK